MDLFLEWFEEEKNIDAVLVAGIAHLWFVTIHPFEDGNGRMAHAITDLMLAHSEGSSQRFYSMSARIRKEPESYYNLLEATQKGSLNITKWLQWFISCLGGAFDQSEETLRSVLDRARFWEALNETKLNERQRRVLNRLLDGFDSKLTSTKWAKLAKCSQDTATRDIEDLVRKGILVRGPAGGRSTSYELVTI